VGGAARAVGRVAHERLAGGRCSGVTACRRGCGSVVASHVDCLPDADSHSCRPSVCALLLQCHTAHAPQLTGPPVAPSCSRTLTMSMGWMMHVAPMPLMPPLMYGLTAFQTGESPMAVGVWGEHSSCDCGGAAPARAAAAAAHAIRVCRVGGLVWKEAGAVDRSDLIKHYTI
jgi:hypothetical protein